MNQEQIKAEVTLAVMQQQLRDVVRDIGQVSGKLDAMGNVPGDVAVLKASVQEVRTAIERQNSRLSKMEMWKERTFGAMAVITLLLGSGVIGLVIAFLVKMGGQP